MTCMRSWRTGLGMGSSVFGALAAVVMSSAMAQSSVEMYGFSRATVPGIPGPQAQGVFPPTYYLYVEVKRGSRVSAEWAWVRGRYYECSLKKVSTPVLVESDPGVPTEKKEVLVPKTFGDVYSVVLGSAKIRTDSTDKEKELIADNEAVIALLVNQSAVYAAVQTIKALRPAAAS